jgi:hypothetical protein
MSYSPWPGYRKPLMTIAALAALLTGCSSEPHAAAGGSDAPGVNLPPSAAQGPAGNGQRTSIATASIQDLSASLRANGVNDPEHWSKVIVQFRPYPANDAGMAKLKTVLGRYQADPDTTGKITNALIP